MAIETYTEPKLGELRILATLLQERSITRTAQLLGTTQPAISKVMARLRRQFADPLFVRQGHSMQPTTRALDLGHRLMALFTAVDDLQAGGQPFQPRSSNRQFSLLLTDVGMIHFLPPLVARVAALAPAVSVRAVPLQSHNIEARLEAGDADLALGAFPNAARHLRRQRLYSDSYLSVVRRSHGQLARLKSRSGFLAAQHILVASSETGHAAHRAAQTALAGEVVRSNVLLQVPSFVAGAIVAAETDGVVTLPANLARRLAGPLGLVAFDCPLALPRIEIAQFWHERFHRDEGHRWIRQLTFDSFGQRR
jgi:DNA-binding transcriptional LysR family regulator